MGRTCDTEGGDEEERAGLERLIEWVKGRAPATALHEGCTCGPDRVLGLGFLNMKPSYVPFKLNMRSFGLQVHESEPVHRAKAWQEDRL